MNAQRRIERRAARCRALLVGIGALAVGEMWCVHERSAAAREAAARGQTLRRELQQVAEIKPAPTPATAQAVADELRRERQRLEQMENDLTGRGSGVRLAGDGNGPASRTDAYFDLAAFVERTRALARARQVAIAPEATHFGFAAYANEAPEPAQIAAVFRQRLVVSYLLESLLEAGPRALLAIKRERPRNGKERALRSRDGPDYFSLDARLSAAAPGDVETTAFRIVFSGETAALRALLNKLAAFELPILVRGVEVEPAGTAEAGGNDGNRPGTDWQRSTAASVLLQETGGVSALLPAVRPAPIVTRSASKFTITVEYLALTGKAGATPAGQVGALPQEPWRPPAAQSRGRDWIFDTFTPPEIFYHARVNEFTIHPPTGLSEEPPREAFGVEVLSIRPETFRLRLIGYVGRPGDWQGSFENILTGEIFLAAAGCVVPQQNVEIRTIAVAWRPVNPDEGAGGPSQRIGTSRLRDTFTGNEVMLTEGMTGVSGTMFATIGVVGASDAREVRAGDRFQIGEADYAIEEIKGSPASVAITKHSPKLAQPERRVLMASAPEGIP